MLGLGHRLLALLAVGLIGSAAGCGGSTADDDRGTPVPTVTEEGGVRVSASYQSPELVRVHFEPLREGFHLYSLTLPDGGVDGLGIPTRVSAGAGLRASGPARATVSAISLDMPSLGVRLPVYPDGPVDVLLPVEEPHGADGSVIVTYGACSEEQCLVPVRDLEVGVAP